MLVRAMPSPLTAGTVLIDFRIESLISSGAMSSVYLAEDTARGGSVALKVLAPDLGLDERFRQRFLRESRLAAGVDHPHVVRTIASGEEDGMLYLAMEYVDGSDLRVLLRRDGPIAADRAISLLVQVADALDAAHAAGLVHRDVKPGNILVAGSPPDEIAYVCDFGVARHVSSASSLTGDRGVIGTIDYIPPEQIEGGSIDGRADVYSLGCVLFECLAGMKPFDRESELSVVFAHLNEPPPRASELQPDLPEALDGVFRTALAKVPDDRYATCAELIEAARAALDGTAPAPVHRKRRRLPVLLTLVAALGVLAAIIGSVLATRGTPAKVASITNTMIAGAPLGLTKAAYKKHYGIGYREDRRTVPSDYSVLIFINPDRKIGVYFQKPKDAAIEITTWNPAFRTSAGVGPCSTIAQLKAAYGARLVPSKPNIQHGKIWAYLVGRLIFATDFKRVTVVALYHGAPNVSGGALSYASFIALTETAC